MNRVLKDIGVDILALGPTEESEPPFDYDGVDFLATTILTGLLNWLGKLDHEDWPIQPWFECCCELVQLLRRCVYNCILVITITDQYSPDLVLKSSFPILAHLQLPLLKISGQVLVKKES
jgi:hypothetical protein